MRGNARVFLLCGLISTLSVTANSGEFGDFGGRRFILKAVNGEAVSFDKEVAIQFGADGMLSGRVCNTFRGKGSIERGILVAGPMMSTRMLCAAGGLSELENKLFAMLNKGAAVIETADGIELRRDDAILAFAEAADAASADNLRDKLTGRRFALVRINGEAFVAKEGQHPNIGFAADMRVSGSACNSFSGPGELKDGKLYVRNAAATMKMCIDPTLSQLERDVHRILREGAAVTLDGNTLVLKGDGTELTYELER